MIIPPMVAIGWLLACGLLAGRVSAQQRTWIVDWQFGPGADFRDIQPAVDAAAQGDVIRVRVGGYGPLVVSKGITILGDGSNPSFVPPAPEVHVATLSVNNVPRGERVVLVGVGVLDQSLRPTDFEIADCDGLVYIERTRTYAPGVNVTPGVRILRSRHVVVVGAGLGARGAPNRIEASDVWIRDSALQGFSAAVGTPAFDIVSSRVRIEDSSVQGTNGVLWMRGSELWTAGSQFGAGLLPDCSFGPSIVHVGPGNGGIGPGAVRCLTQVASQATHLRLGGLGFLSGGTMDVEMSGVAGDLVFLFAGLPSGSAIHLPFGEAWVDPNAPVEFLGGYTLDVLGRAVSAPIAVPGALPEGLPFTFQGIVVGGRTDVTVPLTVTIK